MNNAMQGHNVYKGEDFFRNGEAVYVNKATERHHYEMHSHDFMEIAYVASGTGTHKIGEMEYSVSKGDLFIINYDIPHGFRCVSSGPEAELTVYNCIFKPEFIDYQLINSKDFRDIAHHYLFRSLFPLESGTQNDFVLIGRDSPELEQLYVKMYNEYNRQDTGYIEMLRANVIELFVLITRLYKKAKDSRDCQGSRRNLIIENAIKYMMENYRKDIRLDDLSMLSFFSRNYFCKLFRDSTGMTVSEYIQKLRIQEACNLLRTTGSSIQEISGIVGYSDIKFFNSIFKRNTGITPTAYRKKFI